MNKESKKVKDDDDDDDFFNKFKSFDDKNNIPSNEKPNDND